MKYLWLIPYLFCHSALANYHEGNTEMAAVGHWQFSLAMGLGVHTNPLNGGDNIPLLLVPSVSYYGEKIFFDNGVLGYSIFENNQLVISAITELNFEKSYFSRWHPNNLFINNFSATTPSRENYHVHQVDKKRWAIDAGVQLNWFINSKTNFSTKVLHNINSVYNSYTATIGINHTVTIAYIKNSFFKFGLGAQYNSAKLVDYYYGINQKNDLYNRVVFQGKASLNPIIRVKLSKTLNAHWQLFFHWKRKIINANTANSPLIKTRQIDTVFLGMEYAF